MPKWKGIVGRSFSPASFSQYLPTIRFNAWRPQFVVLHNTAVPRLSDWHKVPGSQRMKGLEHFYRDVQHWSAGPHLFVADDLIWVFTPLNTPGVHSPSWNAVSWGVELVGDYELESLSPASKDTAVSALVALHSTLGLDPNSLRLHREDPRTTHVCPGKHIIKSEIIQSVSDQLTVNHPGEHIPGGAGLAALGTIPSRTKVAPEKFKVKKRTANR
jgi:hypothetical protein